MLGHEPWDMIYHCMHVHVWCDAFFLVSPTLASKRVEQDYPEPLCEKEATNINDVILFSPSLRVVMVFCNYFMLIIHDAKTLPFQRNLRPVPQLGGFGRSPYKVQQNPERKLTRE